MNLWKRIESILLGFAVSVATSERAQLIAAVQAAGATTAPATLAAVNAKIEAVVPAFLRSYVDAELQLQEATALGKLSADPASVVDFVIGALQKAQAKLASG